LGKTKESTNSHSRLQQAIHYVHLSAQPKRSPDKAGTTYQPRRLQSFVIVFLLGRSQAVLLPGERTKLEHFLRRLIKVQRHGHPHSSRRNNGPILNLCIQGSYGCRPRRQDEHALYGINGSWLFRVKRFQENCMFGAFLQLNLYCCKLVCWQEPARYSAASENVKVA
jgi:hypothetical protein